MSTGRPRKIQSPEAMHELIDSYLADCEARDKPITLSGLILHMGLSSRQSLDEYANYDGFFDPVKRAKLIVQLAYEERLHGNSPTGAIFALKNMGWSDKIEQAHTSPDGSMTPQRIEIMPVKPDDDSED